MSQAAPPKRRNYRGSLAGHLAQWVLSFDQLMDRRRDKIIARLKTLAKKRVFGFGSKDTAKRRRAERGVALIAVTVMITVISATTAELSYNARVDYTAAINARDELRAHYLARSAHNLSQLTLRLQRQLIDKDFYKNRGQFGMDINIVDYTGYLLDAFQSKEAADGFASLLGFSGGIKGVGVDVGEFSLEIESLDGRININCGGGANSGAPAVARTAAALAAMMLPIRFNRLFERPDKDGQYNDRRTIVQAIIDWADQDTQLYGSSAAEDHGYDRNSKDKYFSKNHYFDTIDEIRLVRGVDGEWMDAFGKQLTIYGRCKVSVTLAEVPVIMALIMQYAENPQDPALEIRNLTLLAHYVVQVRNLLGKFDRMGTFREVVASPVEWLRKSAAQNDILSAALGGADDGDSNVSNQLAQLPPVAGVKLSAKIGDIAFGSFARRIYRLTAKSKVGLIKKRITAVWDQEHISSQARYGAMGPGGYVYWREE
jgi:general secretion pathway protein K